MTKEELTKRLEKRIAATTDWVYDDNVGDEYEVINPWLAAMSVVDFLIENNFIEIVKTKKKKK